MKSTGAVVLLFLHATKANDEPTQVQFKSPIELQSVYINGLIGDNVFSSPSKWGESGALKTGLKT